MASGECSAAPQLGAAGDDGSVSRTPRVGVRETRRGFAAGLARHRQRTSINANCDAGDVARFPVRFLDLLRSRAV